MNLNKSPRPAERRGQLDDAVVDALAAWREHSHAAYASYQRWTSAPRNERDIGYDEYVAALDREQHAAARYRLLVELRGMT